MKIYVAHPMNIDIKSIFIENELMDINSNTTNIHQKAKVEKIEFLFPEDWSPNLEDSKSNDRQVLSKSIFESNISLMKKSDIILACIDDRDSGVMFEIGYGYALNKTIVTFSLQNFGSNIMIACSSILHCSNINQLKVNISTIYTLQYLKMT